MALRIHRIWAFAALDWRRVGSGCRLQGHMVRRLESGRGSCSGELLRPWFAGSPGAGRDGRSAADRGACRGTSYQPLFAPARRPRLVTRPISLCFRGMPAGAAILRLRVMARYEGVSTRSDP